MVHANLLGNWIPAEVQMSFLATPRDRAGLVVVILAEIVVLALVPFLNAQPPCTRFADS